MCYVSYSACCFLLYCYYYNLPFWIKFLFSVSDCVKSISPKNATYICWIFFLHDAFFDCCDSYSGVTYGLKNDIFSPFWNGWMDDGWTDWQTDGHLLEPLYSLTLLYPRTVASFLIPNHLAGSTGSLYRAEFNISSGERLVSFIKGCEKERGGISTTQVHWKQMCQR